MINTDVIEKVNAQFRLLISQIEDREAEIERLRKALINIQIEYKREGSRFPHLQRVVAINCSAALNPKPEETA